MLIPIGCHRNICTSLSLHTLLSFISVFFFLVWFYRSTCRCFVFVMEIVEVESQFRSFPCFSLQSASVQSRQRFVNIDAEYFNLRWNKIIVESYWCKKNYLKNKYVYFQSRRLTIKVSFKKNRCTYYPRPTCRSTRYHEKSPKYVSRNSWFFSK